ncbi:hypothetical protein HPP92_001329 [Vanilla planifolia]|uniref:Endonuclease/exonuclease/phosphatase domain-containing protein n=1 Tax=Vanilla planifolia TaxID=51239 RepID=A0A835S368_VANPL|nr:hypothetical protein HPP92_001329 [Vanilla planifolia]
MSGGGEQRHHWQAQASHLFLLSRRPNPSGAFHLRRPNPSIRASSGSYAGSIQQRENLGPWSDRCFCPAHGLFCPIHPLPPLRGRRPCFLLHGRLRVTFQNPPATALGRPPGPLFVRRSDPWWICGDFNVSLHSDDVSRTARFYRSAAEDFRQLIDSAGLLIPPVSGSIFTWQGNRNGKALLKRIWTTSSAPSLRLDLSADTPTLLFFPGPASDRATRLIRSSVRQ